LFVNFETFSRTIRGELASLRVFDLPLDAMFLLSVEI
jgi:hypothetical protein